MVCVCASLSNLLRLLPLNVRILLGHDEHFYDHWSCADFSVDGGWCLVALPATIISLCSIIPSEHFIKLHLFRHKIKELSKEGWTNFLVSLDHHKHPVTRGLLFFHLT